MRRHDSECNLGRTGWAKHLDRWDRSVLTWWVVTGVIHFLVEGTAEQTAPQTSFLNVRAEKVAFSFFEDNGNHLRPVMLV